ncbi:MAG: hypothetical protein CVV27_18465, partial [Candidatus Melainabacteria bacterium HGW-Melainabacteria-1]
RMRRLLPAKLSTRLSPPVYLPLPRYFARSRERADLLLAHFSREVGDAELIYTRQGAGKELLGKLQRQRAIWTRTRQVRIWE